MKARAGIIGGVIGAIIKLILDQLTFVIGISSMEPVGNFSKFLFGTRQTNITMIIAYLIVAGLVGWLVSSLIHKKIANSYVISGILIGTVLWALMNITFAVSGAVMPTWSMGINNFIVDLITHAIYGISITYSVWKYKERVAAR